MLKWINSFTLGIRNVQTVVEISKYVHHYLDIMYAQSLRFLAYNCWGGREHEGSRQEKEARVVWVKRQIQIGVVV